MLSVNLYGQKPNLNGDQSSKNLSNALKTLTSNSVLAYPRFDSLKDCPFVVICDGSRRFVVSALGEYNLTAVWVLSNSEQGHIQKGNQLELISLIQAIRWHEPFFRLAPFLIRVGHVTLT